ncbi:DUF4251 domain-containing protein [Halosquirtibacter xylanolyticus]|uniref:DUF4251 domain-containing protein n=1 Tax=Halosquirtibacter xylanolyticus TaxID=3374599 RepID=UPI003747DF80|nr:DUF4251 domain-containing protein [Prolixibacteraceae bacterium]
MIKRLFTVILICILFVYTIQAQSRKEKKAQAYQEMVKDIASGEFNLEATRVNFNSGTRQIQGEGYSLKLKGDSVEAYLPFFGRAYSVDYNGGGAIEFDEPINKIDIRKDEKKRKVQMTLRVVTTKDVYDVQLTLFPGSGTINVSSNRRSSINYEADLVFPKKKSEK